MKKITRFIPLILPLGLLAGSILFSHSCANTTQAPTGGLKDTIPPVIVKVSPAALSTNIPTEGVSFTFTFDEYVKIKTSSNIIISPPQSKPPKSKVKGKSVIVTPEEPLLPNTTYVIGLAGAIVDNNEGNSFPGYDFVFSTGDSIDSLFITGTVLDCSTLAPVKEATVLLYKDHADSAVFKSRPYMATKTDAWGYFSIRNIQDTLYRLYAITDANNNSIYDSDGSEKVAFVDSLIKPVFVVNDTLPELQKFDAKDTLACQSRRSEYDLLTFREKPAKQMIMNKKRIDRRSAYITFMAPEAHIDTLWMSGVPSSHIISQFNVERDSLELWINDRRRMPDTLRLFVNYRKTDTLGQLVSTTERVKLAMDADQIKAEKKARKEPKREDTTCVFKLKAEPETVEQIGFQLEFTYPIIYELFDSLKFISVNPKQVKSPAKFTVVPDSLNLRKYSLMPSDKLLTGYEYIMKVPAKAFRDINGNYSDSTEVKVSLPTDEKLSTLTLNMTGVQQKYIVEIMDEKKSKALRTRIIDSDVALVFPYLKGGKYHIRVTEDVNRNTIVDTGSLLAHRQPEKVKFLKLAKNDNPLEIKESSEITQDVNLAELFK
jgi:hypothetical protein